MNNITYDPQDTNPVHRASAPLKRNAAQSNYILLQTSGPLTPEQKRKLQEQSIEIHEYVPDNTYLCGYRPSNLDVIRRLSFVNWVNTYPHGFKVSPTLALHAEPGEVKSLAEVALAPEHPRSREPKTVDVVFHRDVDPDRMRDRLAGLIHQSPEDLRFGRRKARVTVQEKMLPAIAGLDEVRHIEPAPEYKLMNNIARAILGLPSPRGVPGALLGSGQIVAVADTGFDKGSVTDVHPAFRGRVLKLYALGRPGRADDPDGHGTHVCGSVLGDANSAILGTRVSGAAPRAGLVLQSVLDHHGKLGGLPEDLHDLFLAPYEEDGARIHTNSWGDTRGTGAYTANCRELDEFVWQHRDFLICFAAGNAGADSSGVGRISPRSVTAPGTAKNCMTVGASENARPGFGKGLTYGDLAKAEFPADPIFSDEIANNPEGMAAFSGRGPLQSGRNKPDVVAPGTAILSTRSRVTKSEGLAPTPDPLYFFDAGTSMATPLVAGCAAVVREFLAASGIESPSAALVKAMLINGAIPMKGQYAPSEVGSIPSISEGFGRIFIPATVGPFPKSASLLFWDEGAELDTGEAEEAEVVIRKRHQRLKTTLVWTDPPGESLQNDLDLIVVAANGEERHGNAAAGSAIFDRQNNVEQITWVGAPVGAARVIVRAHRVAAHLQSFALVVSLT